MGVSKQAWGVLGAAGRGPQPSARMVQGTDLKMPVPGSAGPRLPQTLYFALLHGCSGLSPPPVRGWFVHPETSILRSRPLALYPLPLVPRHRLSGWPPALLAETPVGLCMGSGVAAPHLGRTSAGGRRGSAECCCYKKSCVVDTFTTWLPVRASSDAFCHSSQLPLAALPRGKIKKFRARSETAGVGHSLSAPLRRV